MGMIDREKVIRHITAELCIARTCKKYFASVDIDMLSDALDLLKEQEAKTGHWIDTTKAIGFPRVQCSVCGSGQGAIWMNHCPNCGAHMVKDS